MPGVGRREIWRKGIEGGGRGGKGRGERSPRGMLKMNEGGKA